MSCAGGKARLFHVVSELLFYVGGSVTGTLQFSGKIQALTQLRMRLQPHSRVRRKTFDKTGC